MFRVKSATKSLTSLLIALGFLVITLSSCDAKKSDKAGGSYVKPSLNYKGQTRKGHVRKKVSTDKNAMKNQNRSRYYYQTRGKYRRKKK
ncbi:MAG: hypothetical protein FJZ66_03365 [Bacteroidetes bacterium]|nr:hypothetical protein [Bacteroidota bacterium]